MSFHIMPLIFLKALWTAAGFKWFWELECCLKLEPREASRCNIMLSRNMFCLNIYINCIPKLLKLDDRLFSLLFWRLRLLIHDLVLRFIIRHGYFLFLIRFLNVNWNKTSMANTIEKVQVRSKPFTFYNNYCVKPYSPQMHRTVKKVCVSWSQDNLFWERKPDFPWSLWNCISVFKWVN